MLVGGLGGAAVYLLDTVYLFLPETFNTSMTLLNSVGLVIFSIRLLNLKRRYTGVDDLKKSSILYIFIAVVQLLFLYGIVWMFIEINHQSLQKRLLSYHLVIRWTLMMHLTLVLILIL